ncbi:MAG: SAM-dependent methyltransferase [Paracoccaceae bacterium]
MAIREKIYYRRVMTYNYDKLYSETPDALGEPIQVFVDFFNKLEQENLRVLDVGCGQGRDALFIARLGHRVVGVDISPNGIRDLLAAANREKLPVEGDIADVATYAPDGMFDLILIDRTLHMLPKDAQLSTLGKLLDHVAKNGLVLIADEASNIGDFASVISAHQLGWQQEFVKRGYLFIRRN